MLFYYLHVRIPGGHTPFLISWKSCKVIVQWLHLTSRPVAEPKGRLWARWKSYREGKLAQPPHFKWRPFHSFAHSESKGFQSSFTTMGEGGRKESVHFGTWYQENRRLLSAHMLKTSQSDGVLFLLYFCLCIWSFIHKNKQVSCPRGQQNPVVLFLLK